jgi:hypothetical protein
MEIIGVAVAAAAVRTVSGRHDEYGVAQKVA